MVDNKGGIQILLSKRGLDPKMVANKGEYRRAVEDTRISADHLLISIVALCLARNSVFTIQEDY